MTITLRPYTPSDADAVLRLNEESVAVLSPLNTANLHALAPMSELFTVAESPAGVVGFLLALADGQSYDSDNYRYFATRFKRFLYIDRVVVSPACRGQGLGQRFYAYAEEYARSRDLAWLVCEVDVEPPNPISLRFHAQQGFIEVGRQFYGPNRKGVSLQIRAVG